MKFSKHIFVIAAIATVSVIGMASPSQVNSQGQRSVASDSAQDVQEREARMTELKGKISQLDTEIREHLRKEDSGEDKAQRQARIDSIKKHKHEVVVSLNTFEDKIEARRDAELASLREEVSKMRVSQQKEEEKIQARMKNGDKGEDAQERAARKAELDAKLQLIEDTISSNASNDARAVRMAYDDVVKRLETSDKVQDAKERAERQAKFHDAKDKVRVFFGMKKDGQS